MPDASIAEPAAAVRTGRLVLARETKHRGGKAVVVIRGFATLPHWDQAAVASLARELKQALACGGTVEPDLEILVQGDRPGDVAAWLRAQGFRVAGVTG
jgi:translation initiation factor 1 (eIF-1/SUI1)